MGARHDEIDGRRARHRAPLARRHRGRAMNLRDRDGWIAAVVASPDLTTAQKVIGVRLALHLRISTGRCNPTYPTLAQGSGCTRATAAAAIAVLERLGFLRHTGSKGGPSNQYALIRPATVHSAGRLDHPA